MKDNDKILAQDLIKISEVSTLLTGDRFKLRLDRGFGQYEASVNRLFSAVQDWIDSDKSYGAELTTPLKEFVSDLPREFEPKSVVMKPKTEIPNDIAQTDDVDTKEIKYLYTFPIGSKSIEIIGHKVFKHHSDEIFYIKLPNGKEFKYAILNSEKDVKTFIRTVLIK